MLAGLVVGSMVPPAITMEEPWLVAETFRSPQRTFTRSPLRVKVWVPSFLTSSALPVTAMRPLVTVKVASVKVVVAPERVKLPVWLSPRRSKVTSAKSMSPLKVPVSWKVKVPSM